MSEDKQKVVLEADIKIEKETIAMREAASCVIKLPEGKEKQPDLLYFSAIFVSSGENLNHAYFMTSEIVAAEGTIINKALDVEHKEEDIIGHIYERAFIKKDGTPLYIEHLTNIDKASLDSEEIHVVIAGIIYKDRFPAVAKEVCEGKWKVSMETYFTHFDVKVGDMVIPSDQANCIGISASKYLGKVAKVFKDGVEVANGVVTRVLRNLCFSGCGIVEKPANPPSVILEVACENIKVDKEKSNIKEDASGILIVNILDKVTSSNVDSNLVNDYSESDKAETVESDNKLICVNYKKQIHNCGGCDTGSDVLHEDWCTLYDSGCTSNNRSAKDKNCLISKARLVADKAVSKFIKASEHKEKYKRVISDVEEVLFKAEQFIKKSKED